MLWGIPGVMAGALLAVRLGAAALWIGGVAAVGLGVFLLWKGRTAYALPLLLGLLLLRGAILPYPTVIPGTYAVTGTVTDAPEQARGRTVVVLSRVTLDGHRVPGAMELTIPYRASLAYGDALSLQAQVVPDQRGAVRSLSTVLYAGEATGEILVLEGRADPLYGLALRWRERLGATADALFGEDSGLAKGILFGDKDDVGYLEFLAFRRSGLLHLLTVSGLHVGVVCGAALRLLRGRRKWLRFLFSALLLLLFCMLTGLAPSSLRAAVMLLAVRFAHLLDRQDDPLSEIGCALALLLVINPAFLTAPGFRLSFGAVWGLICLTTPVLELLHGCREGAMGLLAGAVAVFLGTMPLLSMTGSEISWVGVFVSLLALPVAPLFLIPGWAAVLLHPLVPQAAKAVALLPRGVLFYLTTLAELTPVDGFTLPPCGGLGLLLWFTGMLFVSPNFLLNREKPAYLGWGLMAAGALAWFLL